MNKKNIFYLSIIFIGCFYLGLSANNFREPFYFTVGAVVTFIISEIVDNDIKRGKK